MGGMDELLKLVAFEPKNRHRPYVNSAVRFHHPYTTEDHFRAALAVHWNVFQYPSEMVIGDLISDSGSTTPTIEQISLSLLGDEAYGTNWGYPQIIEAFEHAFGISSGDCEIYLFHQGRAAEHALFSELGKSKQGFVVPNNGHFDTTRANIEQNGMRAVDLPVQNGNLLPDTSEYYFQGNMDLKALEDLLAGDSSSVPLVYETITNNTIAGQPVSIENLKAVRALCDKYGKALFFDAARFALNAWFVKRHEPGYAHKSIKEITHEAFQLCDGFTISLKKDALGNMGGALVVKKSSSLIEAHPALLENIRDHQILTEGHPTYGGLSGREIMILVGGLKIAQDEALIGGYVGLTEKFGAYMDSLGIPVFKPFGGHAIYIDIDEFFKGTRIVREDFGGISLTALLLLSGPRLCELGAFAFGHFDSATGKEVSPPFNRVRCAIPRNKYEEQDLFFIADCIKNLHDRRDSIPRAIPVYGRDAVLRHFKARFELKQ